MTTTMRAAGGVLRRAAFRAVEADEERCKGCGLCVAVCDHGALALAADRVNAQGHHPVELVAPARCTSCVRCARICPDAALTVLAPPRMGSAP